MIFHLVGSHCIDTCVLPSLTWCVLDPGGDMKAKLFVVSLVYIHLRRHPACCYKGRDYPAAGATATPVPGGEFSSLALEALVTLHQEPIRMVNRAVPHPTQTQHDACRQPSRTSRGGERTYQQIQKPGRIGSQSWVCSSLYSAHLA